MVDSRPRALVIDDDAGVRETVCLLLETFGYATEQAADGQAGLARFAEGAYALVVTDLVMPHRTGWEVAEILRQQAPHVGVVLMTGGLTDEVIAWARALRLPLIAKPFSVARLRKAVEEARQGLRENGG